MTAVSSRLSPARLAAAAFALAMAAACHHDSGTEPTAPSGTSNSVTVTIDSGSNLQIAVVNKTIRVSIHAANPDKSPLVGQTVNWNVAAGNGTVSAPTTTTSATGQASVDWKLGTAAGINNLTVAVSGVVVTVSATGAPDVLTGLIKVTTDSQTVVATSSTSFVVRATDAFGNGISGVVVNWTATAGTLTPATTTTGDSGNAQVTFTTGALPAKYSITATTTGFASRTFTLTGS